MTKHTPGPWTVIRAAWNEEGDVNYTLEGVKAASAYDARLIAAAPDLLEALKDLISRMSEPGCSEHRLGDFLRGLGVENARAAIAKAEGLS